jgi:phenylacetate-coenzyme A ligase PaaK-like adenylate-forming protein
MMPAGAKKLLRLLGHARRTTSYYSGLPDLPKETSPSRLRDVFSRIHPLTRNELRAEQTRLISRAGDASSWRRTTTTGTTGEPVEMILDRGARAAETGLFAAHLDRVLPGVAWRAANVFHLALHPGAASRSLPSPWNPSARSVKWNLIRIWQSPDDRIADRLRWIDGCVVTMLPSVAQLMCARLSRFSRGRKVSPSLVVLAGEHIAASVRALVGETLRCPVTSLYTLAEAGIVGMECLDGGHYRADEAHVVVEILAEDGSPTVAGDEGEIAVTPLDNLAMPLLRYRTGDRGLWREAPGSNAPHAGCLELRGTRRPRHLVSQSGASMNVVRFAKVLAALDVDHYDLGQLPDKTVVFTYSAATPLDSLSHSIVNSAIRGALGPDCPVFVRKLSSQEAVGTASDVDAVQVATEPEGPGPAEVAEWLRKKLRHEPGIAAAALMGSGLDAETTTRYSDLDLIILVHGDPFEQRWMSLFRALKAGVPKLSANFDRTESLSRRAPLLASRLLSEGLSVVGRLDETIIPRPSLEELRAFAVFWAQDALATLWHRLVLVEDRSTDPIREAWLAAKYGLDALRLRYLLRGRWATAGGEVLAVAQADPDLLLPWRDLLLEAIEVSREHRPPLRPDAEASHAYLLAALSCVRDSISGLRVDRTGVRPCEGV